MKYFKENAAGVSAKKTWLFISKFFLFCFLLYVNWYKEIWGDRPVFLYGSVIALTGSVVISFTTENHSKIKFRSLPQFFWTLLIFGVYCFITGFFVSAKVSSFVSSMVTYFCFLVVLADCCIIAQQSGEGWRWLLEIFFYIALICAVYAIFRGQGKSNGGAIAYTMGPLNNPNSLAHVLLIGIFGLATEHKEEEKFLYLKLFFALVISYAIMRTGSRKTLISTAVLLAIWVRSILKEMKTRKNKGSNIIIILGIIIAAGLVVWYIMNIFMESDQYDRFMQLFNDEGDNSNEERIKMYQLAFQIWQARPVFGVGFNQYQFYSWRGDYSHSTYAEVLSCTGTIGVLILFVPVLVQMGKMIASIRQSSGNKKYVLNLCLAGLLAEFFLGAGGIWIYGINHEICLLCILGIFENQTMNNHVTEQRKEVKSKCRYIK